jgi:hypothetical protein
MREPRPARGLLFLVPCLVLWLVAWAIEEGVGFAPAAAQVRPPPITRPTTTLPGQTTATTEEPATTTPETTATTAPPPTLPQTTFMPSTSRRWGGPAPSAPTPRVNGTRWVCAPNAGTPGTHCWDP